MAGDSLNSGRAISAAAVSAAAGFLSWALFAFLTPSREAWDNGTWWLVVLPLLALVSGVLGYVAPRRVWRWPAWITVGEIGAILLIRRQDTDFGLFPLAVVFVLIPLAIAFTFLALIGGVCARGGRWNAAILW
ncbi:MAG TPA: hypothetical protein VG894_11950 [Bauldia sp.]|nr:hypothetical protein [Bauldia sp.]